MAEPLTCATCGRPVRILHAPNRGINDHPAALDATRLTPAERASVDAVIRVSERPDHALAAAKAADRLDRPGASYDPRLLELADEIEHGDPPTRHAWARRLRELAR